MRTSQPAVGQRWVSDSEPELGLGMILQAGAGRIEVFFAAADERRQYALKSAPLRRVQFKEGDRIELRDGASLVVERVEARGDLFVYHARGREVTEADLSDLISFSTPEDRLFAGQVDDLPLFDLRVEALRRRTRMRQAKVRGFVGARVDLIAHQMSIAGEVTSRLGPRVLLADEVGLGKTIEAGLILHRLHLTGRADRVLILVPEPLLHQWFVEFLRRFNLLFSIFDEERCESIEQHDRQANPFLDSQLVLCSTAFLAANSRRREQATSARWDLLVVDEAHHLEWTRQGASSSYVLVEALAQQTPGLLLLTATPQQLGAEGHFARLRLLDPDRYADLDQFLSESEHYEEVAVAVDRLRHGEPLSRNDRELFGRKSERVRSRCAQLAAGDESARHHLISDLLDEYGTGRVLFRNTRAALGGFPARHPLLAPVDAAAVNDPFLAKVEWLAALLGKLGAEKVLLICRSQELAEETAASLQREVNVKCALFHEGLTLLQRDRNAAFFAEDDGARILICSEIGSEGRNFQFAHHLVLFDLPLNPELLEQRIGRLDRIGQSTAIAIHVPYLAGTESEVLARWYHEGLNAFEKNPHGAAEVAKEVEDELSSLREKHDAGKLNRLIERSKRIHAQAALKLRRGHDRLLELSSCDATRAGEMIRLIGAADGDREFEEFFIRLLDHFGVHVEDLDNRSYLLLPGHLITDSFPSLPAEGMSVTFERARALSREDIAFMSSDHPLVRGALDLLLGSEAGNAAFGIWRTPGAESILLEFNAVVECIAPLSLHADRFLPGTAIRVVVDHALRDQSNDDDFARAQFEKGDLFALLDRTEFKNRLLPEMLAKAHALAVIKMRAMVEAAGVAMERQLQDEIGRLEDLRQINNHVRPEEIAALHQQKSELLAAIKSAQLRVDALRLIWRRAA